MDILEKPFATGRTAEIYSYGEGKILKLFFPTIPQFWSDREADIGLYIQEAQLPVPKVFERVKVNDRDGVVYERIDGASMLNQLGRMPWNGQEEESPSQTSCRRIRETGFFSCLTLCLKEINYAMEIFTLAILSLPTAVQ
jgi:hypothetical protein